jgi:hypothetical protein
MIQSIGKLFQEKIALSNLDIDSLLKIDDPVL